MTCELRHHRTRGFTLIEVLFSFAIMSLVVAACASVMVLSARSIGNSSTALSAAAASSRAAADQVADDLKVALAITEQTPTSLAFTVPDRNGDGQPETIRYAWSGTPGAPLTRQYNGGPVVAITDNVRSFNLSYALNTAGSTPGTETAEMLLAAHDGGSGASVRSFAIKTNSWMDEYINPMVPPSTICWRITHVKVQLQQATGGSGMVFVQACRPSAGQTPAAVLETVLIDAGGLPAAATWVDVPFTTLKQLDPTQGICIVVGTSATGTPANCFYDNSGSDPGTLYGWSSNGGANWGTSSNNALQYYMYGTLTQP